MKIVIPVIGFGKSGGQRVLSWLGTSLVENGASVTFVAPKNCEPLYYQTKANITYINYKVGNSKIINFIRIFFGLIQAINSMSPNIVIANYFITSYLLIFVRRSIKKVYYIQADESKLHARWYLNFLARLSYRMPWLKIVNSDKILPVSLNNFKKIVPAGVDIGSFYPAETPGNKIPFTLGIIGRKETYKGTNELLSVLSEQQFVGVFELKVAIYFPEEFVGKFEKLDVVVIENDSALARFYRSCDLIIATGLIEDGAFHYPCAEAMATGRVVISNYAPLTETSSEFVVPHFSPELIREKLQKFISMTDEQLALEVDRNKKYAMNFSWERIGKDMFSYLKSIVN